MAQILQEPPTSGKLILKTTHGDLDIELWTKEAPLACRNFIQLCMEGYYDNNIFFRLIPGFMIQAGDPSGTGRGGESIYGDFFADEFHQRLKFSHRGRVAMANEERPNSNASQFFITFDSCSWLDKKHTIFGKIMGDTIYNLLNMQSIDTDSTDRPVNPPRILSANVLINPFEDIFVRNKIYIEPQQEQEIQKVDKKIINEKKNKQKQNTLSFDDEEDDYNNHKLKIQSLHDVIDDEKLSKQPAVKLDLIEQKKQELNQQELKLKQLKENIKNPTNKGDEILKKVKIDGQEPKIQSKEVDKLQNYKFRRNKKNGQREIYWEESEESSSSSEDSQYSSTDSEKYENEQQKEIRQKQKQEYENLKIDFLKFKKEKLGTNNPQEINRIKHEKKLLSNLEMRKLKYIESQTTKQQEQEKLNQLESFRSTLNSKNFKSNRMNWMNHSLKFHIDSARAYQVQQVKEKVKEYNIEDDMFAITDTMKEKGRKQNESQIKLQDIMPLEKLMQLTEKN